MLKFEKKIKKGKNIQIYTRSLKNRNLQFFPNLVTRKREKQFVG